MQTEQNEFSVWAGRLEPLTLGRQFTDLTHFINDKFHCIVLIRNWHLTSLQGRKCIISDMGFHILTVHFESRNNIILKTIEYGSELALPSPISSKIEMLVATALK